MKHTHLLEIHHNGGKVHMALPRESTISASDFLTYAYSLAKKSGYWTDGQALIVFKKIEYMTVNRMVATSHPGAQAIVPAEAS